MRKLTRKLIALAAAALAFSVTFAAAPTPTAAAGLVYYVDDTSANNGSVSCPGPVVGTTLQDGFDVVLVPNTTVYVCPGDYNNPAAMLGSTNFKLIAKGNVFLTANASFSGDFIAIYGATNFTIQGFIIDGANQLGTNANAIAIYQASGSIVKNTINRWREPNPAATTGIARAILIDNFGGSLSNKVKVDHNTIYQFQNFGIEVGSMNGVAITHNYLQWSAGGNYSGLGIHMNYGASGSISGNTLMSNYNMGSGLATIGIMLTETVSTKVSANRISMVTAGVWVSDFCDITNARLNTISGNTFTDNDLGVKLYASYTSCLSDTKGNVISTNKFIQHFVPHAAIELNTNSSAIIEGTIIKSNTYTGYLDSDPTDMIGTITGTVETKNKIIFLLPPGA